MKEPGFDHKWNYDDVFARAVIVGFMQLIDTVKIKFQISDTKFENKRVPYIYGLTGQERYLQDFLLNIPSVNCSVLMEGSTDVIPRAHVNLVGDRIVSAALRNKFVRGSYVVEEQDTNGNKTLRTYSAYINMIPMEFTFNIEVRGNTLNELYKIKDQVISTFYKARKFNSTYKGFRIPCQAGFPDELTVEKMFEYTYPSGESWSTMKYTILVESYFPVIDETTALFRGNLMKAIDLNLSMGSTPTINQGEGVFTDGDSSNNLNPVRGTVTNAPLLSNLNEIPFLSLWLKSEGITEMGKLSTWVDSSIAKNNVVQYHSDGQPKIIDPLFCAEKGIFADGINNTLEIPNINIISEIHGFLMIKTENLNIKSGILIGNTGILEDRWVVGFNNGDIYFTAGINENAATISYQNTIDDWSLVEFWFSNGVLGLKIQNQLIGIASTSNQTIGNINSKTYLFSNNGLFDFLSVNMTECLIWKKLLTDKQREFVIDNITKKYHTF